MKTREIKFKAWDKFTKKMWQWDEHNAFDTGAGSIKRWFCDSDLEIMQFTGLHTISNQEIYENDIVTFRCPHCIKEHRGEIVWIAEMAAWGMNRYELQERTPITMPIDEHDLDKGFALITFERVIGNIYQNPNLVK